MDKYTSSPCTAAFDEELPGHFLPAHTDKLYLLHPRETWQAFKWRGYLVQRAGFPIAHAAVRTSTSCQGTTLPDGVVVDCARREQKPHPMDDDDWWLHLYVMISRATSLDDLLLLHARDVSFLLRGPLADLRARLDVFGRRVNATRAKADQIARNMGCGAYLR